MKKLLLILAVLCIAARPELVIVCHEGTTMQVNAKSLQAHLNHGDYLGKCVLQPTVTQPTEPAQPLYYMFLLTKDNPPTGWLNYCILRSPSAPSVEIQARLCGWVADNAPCAATVWDTGYWYCDVYGHYRR
jgi:hypothetical protein